MGDLCVYRIRLSGEVDENEINAMSPLQVTIERTDAGPIAVTSCTDQSGLIGLMRHLHGLGFILLSLSRVEMASSSSIDGSASEVSFP